jgi:hypothetical protein
MSESGYSLTVNGNGGTIYMVQFIDYTGGGTFAVDSTGSNAGGTGTGTWVVRTSGSLSANDVLYGTIFFQPASYEYYDITEISPEYGGTNQIASSLAGTGGLDSLYMNDWSYPAFPGGAGVTGFAWDVVWENESTPADSPIYAQMVATGFTNSGSTPSINQKLGVVPNSSSTYYFDLLNYPVTGDLLICTIISSSQSDTPIISDSVNTWTLVNSALGTEFIPGAIYTFACLSCAASTYPTVTTQAATVITGDSAIGNGTITETGGTYCGEAGFIYSSTSFTTPANGTTPGAGGQSVQLVTPPQSFADETFAQEISGLALGTTYYVAAFAQNDNGYSYGNVVNFTTPTNYPVVTTSAATSITNSTATLNADLTNTGGSTVTVEGFVYGTVNAGQPSNGTLPASSGWASYISNTGSFPTGDFSANITGLTAGATYYCCGYASNTSEGYSYGSVVSFSVLDTYPTVTTQAASSVTSTSATGNGNITGLGGAASCSVEGFVYGTVNAGIPANGTAPGSSGWASNASNSGTFSTGAYTVSLTGLSLGTLYYILAFAENSIGYSYGASVQTFTTIGYPTVTTQAASSVTTGGATLNGDITSLGGDSSCTVRGFVYGTTNHGTPANGTAPGSSGWASNTSTSGSYSTGTYTASISSLSASTQYYFCAFTENSAGYSYGNVVSFTTAGSAGGQVPSMSHYGYGF